MSDDTRRCIECGETKPIDQFHAWLLGTPEELVCAQCRGWEDDRTQIEQLRERYQRRMAEWEQQRQERERTLTPEERERERLTAVTPEERERDEQRYLKRLRDYYKREAAHKKEWEPIHARYKDTYRTWVHGLLERGLTPDDVRLIATFESRIFREKLNWPRIRTTFEKVDPPYTRRTLIRRSLSPRLRKEIYDQYQGRCYYCGCTVTPIDQPYHGSPEYVEVRKAYQAQRREINKAGEFTIGWIQANRLLVELYTSELGQRFRQLRGIYQETASTVAHRDHRIPVARGGRDGRDNLVLACQACDLSKNAQTAEEFTGVETVEDDKAVPVDPSGNSADL